MIDGTIAVVIESVAHVGAWILIAIANDHAHGARSRSRRTNARLSGATPEATARIAIVDNTIAVIVEAVASFGCWEYRLCTNDSPGRTGGDARTAQPGQTGITSDTAAGITFVDGAVAIIIDAVANLGRRIIVAIADDGAARARRCSCRTSAQLTGCAGIAAAGVTIVDGAIAIVVEAVAYFG